MSTDALPVATQTDMFPDELRVGEYPIPESGTPTMCRSCGASIVWTRTDYGRAIPLSLATARTCQGQRVALTHFIDCPESRAWRKAR